MAESAAAYITRGDQDLDTAKLVKRAVEERLPRFDHMTLHTIDSLLQSPSVTRDATMAQLLAMVRAEVLKQAGNALPKELQFLDSLALLPERKDRLAVLASQPVGELEAVALCAGQVIVDMEEVDAIPDVSLLAAVVLAHEDVYRVMENAAPGSERRLRPRRAGVPRAVAAFVKELMALGDALSRRAQIASALDEGCKAQLTTTEGSSAALELVRPGILLQVLFVIATELAENPPPEVRGKPEEVQLRLQQIRDDVLVVVELMRARGRRG